MRLKEALDEANKATLAPPPLWLVKLRKKIDDFWGDTSPPLPRLFHRKH